MATIHDDLSTVKSILDSYNTIGGQLIATRAILSKVGDVVAVGLLDTVLVHCNTVKANTQTKVNTLTAQVTAPTSYAKSAIVPLAPVAPQQVAAKMDHAEQLLAMKPQDLRAKGKAIGLDTTKMTGPEIAAAIVAKLSSPTVTKVADVVKPAPVVTAGPKPTCGSPTKKGTPCTNGVEKAGDKCGHHSKAAIEIQAPVAAKVSPATQPTLQATIRSQSIPANLDVLSETELRGLVVALAQTMSVAKLRDMVEIAR